MIGKTILHYNILEKLLSTGLRAGGEGGMGVFYKVINIGCTQLIRRNE